jgi:alpha-1,3/alpha-1,6-mannosyltransferase
VKKFQREQLERKNQICYIGRLSKGKGVKPAIEAFMQIYPEYDLKMVLAGGASKNLQLRLDWEMKIKPYIESLISNGAPIELKINPSYQTIINTLLESKALVSYSQHEHFGIVPVEAQAAGCPPIVANSGGQKETIEQGETGFRASSPEELKKYLKLLLENPELWKRMSDNGRAKAKNFSLESIGSQWQNLLEQLCL